jgi:hypothetical protein
MNKLQYSSFVICSMVGLLASSVFGADAVAPAPGTAAEPVRYVGNEQADASHDGGLRYAVGAKNWQAFRANRAHPELSDGYGYTYNHAPMMAYWNNRFYIEYLSAPFHENKGAIHNMLMSSPDGVQWDRPTEVFPFYELPDDSMAQMHQRMGFYVSPNDKLLVMGFYGLPNRPNDGHGVGRVIREVHKDGTFGPVYFIRYSRWNGWNETNTRFPSYTTSPDAGFKQACEALLANRLITLQWQEEDKSKDGFYPDLGPVNLKALSFFHRPDGAVVGLWKSSWAALSKDEGHTWSLPVKASTLVMAEGKISGQRTADGRFALVYNPRADNRHRWPLAVVSGDDGIHFDNLLTVQGDIPLRRYNGLDKAFGAQYNRAIAEGNGKPPGQGFWLTYSMNKDDIWVVRVPVPVTGVVTAPVHDTFDTGTLEDLPWNLYSPQWAPVTLADLPSNTNRSLQLSDADPADYARAVRVFPETTKGVVRFKVNPHQADHGRLEIELTDRHGNAPIRLFLDEQGRITTMSSDILETAVLTRYVRNAWIDIEIKFDVKEELFSVIVDHQPLFENHEMLDPVKSLERVSFRTGPFNDHPTLRDPKSPGEDVAGGDDRVPVAIYNIDDVSAGPVDVAVKP